MLQESPNVRPIRLLVLISALAGCSEFPELSQAVSARARNAAYPQILPLDQLLASLPATAPGRETGTLAARAAALRARARQMAGPVVDATTRTRMQAALARRRQ